jgi:predicted PP-loop superfamily ATPase
MKNDSFEETFIKLVKKLEDERINEKNKEYNKTIDQIKKVLSESLCISSTNTIKILKKLTNNNDKFLAMHAAFSLFNEDAEHSRKILKKLLKEKGYIGLDSDIFLLTQDIV